MKKAERERLLSVADEEHLTLALGLRCGSVLPEEIRDRITADLLKNAKRAEIIRKTYEEIATALRARDLDFLVLKGFSHWPHFVADPRQRPQYDIDLLCRQEHVMRAKDVLRDLGYLPVGGVDHLPIDHLPAMVRKTDWQWRGDYFDLELPVSVELHFRLWDTETEHIAIQGLDDFWDRRTESRIGDFCFPSLDLMDRIAYAALHFLRHVLRGDFRLYHAYEIAHFLEATESHREFWSRWMSTYDPSFRSIQAIGFRLATMWFGNQTPSQVREEFYRAPESTREWFDLFVHDPVNNKAFPNKNELWLHLSLLSSDAERRRVLLRRLIPVPAKRMTSATQISLLLHVKFALRRVRHHLRSTAPTFVGGMKWWSARKGINPQFVRFLAAASLFNFGMSIFFLLYNLFLVQLRFQEDFIGKVSSAMSIGSIAGTLPAAFVFRKLGGRATFLLTFAGLSIVCVARAVASQPYQLIGSAFLGGALFSIYAVSIIPTIAQLTSQRSRPVGYSLFFSLGIGVGFLAGLVGGKLPGILSLQHALLVACGITALGIVPALGLHFDSTPSTERRVYPRGRFIKQFLAVLVLWSLATGAFNPFFTVYFSKNLGMPVSQIGALFSAAQLAQVFALLSAPWILRRMGAISGLMSMQIATGITLAALAVGPSGALAGMAYVFYVSFQYMSEPGMYSLLMERVEPEHQSGASALNFLFIFGAQAIAASAAGFGVRWFGYPMVLAAAGAMAILAAVVLRQIRSSTPTTSLRNLSSVNRDR